MEWNDVFDYKDGILYWKNGKVAGSKGNRRGYSSVTYQYVTYQQHRIIWEMHNGPIPDDKIIDHINRIKTDNDISNLRLSDTSFNAFNSDRKCIYKHAGKWCARVALNGKRKWLGRHSTEEAALEAVRKYKEENNVVF